LILGSVPTPPAIAFLVHLLDEFEEVAQIIGTLRHVGGPDLLAPAVMCLVHQDGHRRPVTQQIRIQTNLENGVAFTASSELLLR
jgi:hypothetical protein